MILFNLGLGEKREKTLSLEKKQKGDGGKKIGKEQFQIKFKQSGL